MAEDKKILHGPGNLRVELDKSQVYRDDPGNGTPAMVYIYRRRAQQPFASSTYNCACGTGELLAINYHDDNYQLTNEQIAWLNSIEDQVGDFLQW